MRIEYCYSKGSNLICRQLPDIAYLDNAISLVDIYLQLLVWKNRRLI